MLVVGCEVQDVDVARLQDRFGFWEVVKDFKEAVRRAGPWVGWIARVGYAAKGVVYATIGVLAILPANPLRVFVPEQQKLLETGRSISSFGEDEQRELYVIDYEGEVLKIVP